MSVRFSLRRGGAPGWLAALLLVCTLLSACGGGSSSARKPAVTPTLRATATATTPPDPTVRQIFEQGVAYPKWGTQSYGAADAGWPVGVASLRDKTNARWIGMTVTLDQDGYSSTTVYAGADTVTADNLYAGVLSARLAGLNVFVEPLLNVRQESNNWSGLVRFSSHAQAQLWFQSYWSVYEPYVKAAKAAGASQVAIATEFKALEIQYPDLWAWLAHQAKATFGGPVTYDLDHESLGRTPPSWWKDPALDYLGVSMYTILQQTPQDVPAAVIEQAWKTLVLPKLDALSAWAGKPIILTEVGYRQTADALTIPWLWQSSARADPALQGAAYQAALAMTAGDRHIAGIFFWGWYVGQFAPGAPAIQAMHDAWARPVTP